MKGKAPRTDLTACYALGRTALKLIADFSDHWERREETYGYVSARIKVPYQKGADFWVHLNLIAQPATFDAWASKPPDVTFEGDDGTCLFEIRDRKLTVIVPLDEPELWGKVHGKSTPLLYIEKCLCRWTEKATLDLRVWITSESDRIPVVQQYQDGEPRTVSGGQFESNRRRH